MPDLAQFPTVLVPAQVVEAAKSDLQRLHQQLQQTTPPEGVHHRVPKGHSEGDFERHLWQYFPGKIHTGLLLPRPDSPQAYMPDFALIEPSLNLHLDIEVDEPYTHETRQPLHFLESEKDQIRNEWFLKWGWVVIRFSEVQVVRSPASCCKAIAATLATLTRDSHLMLPFRSVPTLKPMPRWTKAEAQQMADTQIREQYLSASSAKPTIAKKSRKPAARVAQKPVVSANFTFYCPECGEGPIRWQGHYVCCPTCGCDTFAL